MDLRTKILTLLGEEVNQQQVDVIISLYERRLISMCQKYDSELKAVPEDLEHIIVEIVVARFNRIGSEGMTEETIDGHSASYINDALKLYSDDIKAWAKDKGLYFNTRDKVRFI